MTTVLAEKVGEIQNAPATQERPGAEPRSYPLTDPQNIPYGYCHCGCGQKTRIAERNENRRGWRKGEPIPYIHNHHRRISGAAYVIDPDTGCWIWQRHRNSKGYGMAHDGNKLRVVHRWYWEEENGPVPDSLELDHLCRNRACCNPAHLELVSHTENMRRGASTKLNIEAVREIRSLCAEGWLLKDIGDAYGVSKQNVSSIRDRKTWVDV